MAIDLDKVEELVRTEADADVLAQKLRAMVEEAHPAPVFARGEKIPAHEFVDRFKRGYCGGNETIFWQAPVRIGDVGRDYVYLQIMVS